MPVWLCAQCVLTPLCCGAWHKKLVWRCRHSVMEERGRGKCVPTRCAMEECGTRTCVLTALGCDGAWQGGVHRPPLYYCCVSFVCREGEGSGTREARSNGNQNACPYLIVGFFFLRKFTIANLDWLSGRQLDDAQKDSAEHHCRACGTHGWQPWVHNAGMGMGTGKGGGGGWLVATHEQPAVHC